MSSAESESETAQLPEDLPPVQPPSAGFIIQLFVVPGLIVLAIVAVWALFGKLAGGDQDWRGLVIELRHPNEHRRWRGALGLAQMLKADQELKAGGQHLADNREIGQALADVLTEELKRAGHNDDDLKYEAFLARTLGLFDLPDVVLPSLEQAMQFGVDRDVRKNALGSVAVIADRFAARSEPLIAPDLGNELLKVSHDDDPLIRQLSAFTLGLFGEEWARSRLEVMLGDSDADTRINAAVGLARHGDSRGIDVFAEVLRSAAELKDAGTAAEYEQFLGLKNCLLAIERCATRLDSDQRRDLIKLVAPLAADFREPRIRMAAKSALQALEEAR
jgi:HEAT repeats